MTPEERNKKIEEEAKKYCLDNKYEKYLTKNSLAGSYMEATGEPLSTCFNAFIEGTKSLALLEWLVRRVVELAQEGHMFNGGSLGAPFATWNHSYTTLQILDKIEEELK